MKKHNQQTGLALVSVIIFSTFGIIVIVAGLTLATSINQSHQQFLQAQQALLIAEAGAENALIRLLRNPYYDQEVLTVGDGSARIEVSGTSTEKVVSVIGEYKLASRKIEIQTNFENGVMSVVSWKEVY